MASPSPLSTWMQLSKTDYLRDIQEGKGHDWTVVMGNEAGDLDTVACSIVYAYIHHTTHGTNAVPLVQTARSDLHLRPENQHAFSLAGISDDCAELLCLSDLPNPKGPFPSAKFALVDHNRLGAQFSQDNPSAQVVAVVDHHEDEGLYHDTANPRLVQIPTGSCSSLVAELLRQTPTRDTSNVPPVSAPMAILLLCAIFLDTKGLKPDGKAVKTDVDAAAFLIPFAADADPDLGSVGSIAPEELHDAPAVRELNKTLQTLKADVASLSTRDLLRRDYKEYAWPAQWAPAPPLLVGLASIPVSLEAMLAAHDAEFWSDTEAWINERGLAALGVLTSFKQPSKTEGKKPKNKREQMWVLSPPAAGSPAESLPEHLWPGLEANAELRLAGYPFDELVREAGASLDHVDENGGFGQGWQARPYKQKNADGNRKITAPIVRCIVEGKSTDET